MSKQETTTKHEQFFYNFEIHEALEQLKTSQHGLSEIAANDRLKQHGYNRLSTKSLPLWKKIIEPFASVFVLILIFALGISLFEQKWFEAIIIGVIVVVNALIYYFQQFSVSRVLKTLKAQDVQKVSLLRAGKTVEIDSELIVPGDIIHVAEGMKVPADGRLIESNRIQADEALLTGESLPLHKQAGAMSGKHEIYEQSNMLFKGTYIKGGSGLLLITATGNKTQLGTINELAGQADRDKTPIEQKIDSVISKILIGVGGLGFAIFGLAVFRGLPLEEALRFSLTMIVSAVPEGLPVALTVVLLFSARGMAKQKALVKKISAMETLGAVTLIATDKTGTITQNKLSVASKLSPDYSEAEFNQAIRLSLNVDDDYAQDPLDKILLASLPNVQPDSAWEHAADHPFEQKLRLSGTVWRHKKGYTIYIKGAPEQVLYHCGLSSTEPAVAKNLQHFTGRGYRTIAFAHKDFPAGTKPTMDAHHLRGMSFDGLVGMSDQLRPGIAEAVAQARKAGVKVVMLTGDHVETAGYIATQVGIASNVHQVTSGIVLANGNPEEIRAAIKTRPVFGRVLPEHKYAMIKATKGHEITAMTGDGVNDIPALVEANVGLAMGSGTDAAKDASDVILLDNNFHTIINAIKVGRTVLANIRKMLVYLLGTTGGEVLTMMGALLFGFPLPLSAVQILWVNLVTDGVTVIPLGLSPPESHHMEQPPQHPKAPLLNKILLSRVLLMAIVMSASVLTIFVMNLDKGQAYAQTMAFLSLIVVQWANALSVNFEKHSWLRNVVRPNGKLIAALAFSAVLNLIIFLTPLRQYFGIVAISLQDAAIAMLIPVVLSLVCIDAHKLVSRYFEPRT